MAPKKPFVVGIEVGGHALIAGWEAHCCELQVLDERLKQNRQPLSQIAPRGDPEGALQRRGIGLVQSGRPRGGEIDARLWGRGAQL
eukprot:scaffold363441_cov44-Prasinocladus_malaysianus.AAC.1